MQKKNQNKTTERVITVTLDITIHERGFLVTDMDMPLEEAKESMAEELDLMYGEGNWGFGEFREATEEELSVFEQVQSNLEMEEEKVLH